MSLMPSPIGCLALSISPMYISVSISRGDIFFFTYALLISSKLWYCDLFKTLFSLGVQKLRSSKAPNEVEKLPKPVLT